MKKAKVITRVGEIIIAVVVVLCIGWYIGFAQSSQPTKQVPVSATEKNSTSEQPKKITRATKAELLNLVNEERAKAGVKPLKEIENMDEAAQLKADDMTNRQYESHIIKGTDEVLTPKMSELDYAQCSYVSENYYWGTGDLITSKAAMDLWMHSKPHHDAILDSRYTYTGFGVSGTDKITIVEHFCIAK